MVLNCSITYSWKHQRCSTIWESRFTVQNNWFYYSAQNGSESRFRVKCFFLGSTSVTYYGLFYCIIWSVLRHCWRLIAPLDLRQCFSILVEFQVIRKGCIFSPFLPFVLLFVRSCCNSAFILELHRCSKGRSISRVQTENCYYFRNGFCFSLWVNCRVGYCLEWKCRVGYCHACCTIGVVLPILSGYYLSFKLSGKILFLLGPELPIGDGWERASHWSCITPLEIIFLDTIWVSSDQERLWRIWRWFVIWCGEFVWQWRKFKRGMWRSCFRKTLCGLKRNKGCWLNARRTKRMKLVGEVGWSIGECRFIFTMPVAVAAESSLSLASC